MTTSSSSVPVLGPVLYFTSTDGYSYDVDNRPLFNLDTNIRHINTSIVGIGYGEHSSLSGGQLSPGTVVSLAPNGSIFYPTVAPSASLTQNIVGLVIGATDTGLNRVIWSSKHLDLDVLGLSSVVAGSPAGSYLTTQAGSNGQITVKTTPTITTDYIVGRIKNGSYIEVNTASELIANDASITVNRAVLDNHANLYGLTRFRNLLAFVDAGQVPLQYTKRTVRMSEYFSSNIVYNPMNAKLSTDFGNISATNMVDAIPYASISGFDSLVLKESYTQFLTSAGSDSVSCGTASSGWADLSYANPLNYGYNSQNYDRQQIGGSGTDYGLASNLSLFKQFRIDKYYQYTRTAQAPLAKSLSATATVFNPLNVIGQGGEGMRIIVWDFYNYTIAGLEQYKQRIVLTGEAAEQALLQAVDPINTIFPLALLNY